MARVCCLTLLGASLAHAAWLVEDTNGPETKKLSDLTGKCHEIENTVSGLKLDVDDSKHFKKEHAIVWDPDAPCGCFIHFAGSDFEAMTVGGGEAKHEYHYAEFSKDDIDKVKGSVGECGPCPKNAKDKTEVTWTIANKKRGGQCDEK
eukprot:TRINITY_DN121674_c0_g1_i1.p1 TRINITY_DN121674_c0_g1~~TRINITY_DN121674_c0_g1_i1.p1  ORF type:complete len:148 (-),score=26.30 TRINITY_DN121674_c0_g1_i1:337-780(-)